MANFCECGCGGITNIYRGVPRRFIDKHYSRLPQAWEHLTSYWQSDVIKKTQFRVGSSPWNKGKKGYKAGEDHYNWKGGITSLSYRERRRFKKTMQKLIFERDNYTCQMCGDRGVDLQVDHIQPWAEYVELRFNMENCRTLCKPCHYKITFGKPMRNTAMPWGHTEGRGAK